MICPNCYTKLRLEEGEVLTNKEYGRCPECNYGLVISKREYEIQVIDTYVPDNGRVKDGKVYEGHTSYKAPLRAQKIFYWMGFLPMKDVIERRQRREGTVTLHIVEG